MTSTIQSLKELLAKATEETPSFNHLRHNDRDDALADYHNRVSKAQDEIINALPDLLATLERTEGEAVELREAALEEARKRLEAECAIVRLLRDPLDAEAIAHAQTVLDNVNEPATLPPADERLREAGLALLAKLDETLPATEGRPTIAELETMLAIADGSIEIKPDGSIHVAPRAEIEAFRAALTSTETKL